MARERSSLLDFVFLSHKREMGEFSTDILHRAKRGYYSIVVENKGHSRINMKEWYVVDTVEGPDELADRLKKGDQEALAALFNLHRERLVRMVGFRMDRRLLGRIDPDDIIQEAYLAALQRLSHYNDESSISPFVWMRMVLMQTMIDIHRHHLGVQMRDADREVGFYGHGYPQTTSASLAMQFVGNITSPSQAAVREEMLLRVEQAVAEMEPLDREVLALRHFEELSNSEVAEVLGIQQKAASIRYVRAIKRLRAVLSQLPDFFGGNHDG
jgi:RNA polymerase sigma-70 factor, ECF subfamily